MTKRATPQANNKFRKQFTATHIDTSFLQKPGILIGEIEPKIIYHVNKATFAIPGTPDAPSPEYFEGGAAELFLLINDIKRPEHIENLREDLRTSLRGVEMAIARLLTAGILAKEKTGREPSRLRLRLENWRNLTPVDAPKRTKAPVVDEPIPAAAAAAEPIPGSTFVVLARSGSKPVPINKMIQSVRYCNEGQSGELTQWMSLIGTELVIFSRAEELSTRRTERESKPQREPSSPQRTSVKKSSFAENKRLTSPTTAQIQPPPPARPYEEQDLLLSDVDQYLKLSPAEQKEWRERFPKPYARLKNRLKTTGASAE